MADYCYKELLEIRLCDGYTALAELEPGTEKYKMAAESLKALQEAYNGIIKSENARYAVDARTQQNRDMTIADMKMRGMELLARMGFKGFWNSRWLNVETDGVFKTLGGKNRMNDTGKW